jgi:hypothetical protein
VVCSGSALITRKVSPKRTAVAVSFIVWLGDGVISISDVIPPYPGREAAKAEAASEDRHPKPKCTWKKGIAATQCEEKKAGESKCETEN